jgi:NAD(P)-dependent dehydrogenase (short-subunit alcohol dehydrogenase family)
VESSRSIAVVTGACGGLGLEISRQLAEAGAHVCVADLSLTEAQKAVESLSDQGFSASAHAVNVSDESEVNRLGADASQLGQLTAWVNNAGITRRVAVVEETLEGWNRVMSVNATGAFLGTQVAARIMLKMGHGSIVNISSICANRAMLGTGSYGASKAAVVGLTIHAALELAAEGIRVNAILPGTVRTPMNQDRLAIPEQRAWSRERIPTARPGTPEEVAALVRFLCSPEASYINGAAIPCDGGWASHA